MRPAIPRSVSTGDHLTPAPHAESHASRHAARQAHPMPLVASGDPVSPTASIRPNRIRRRRWRPLDGRAPGPPPSARHHHEITTLHQRPRTGHRRHVEAASRRHSEPHALRVTGRRGQRHYRELNHLAGARQHTGKRVDDVADDRRRHGGSVDRDVFVSSAVAFDTCCAYHPSRLRRQPPSARCGYCAASHTARDSSVIWLGATAEEMSLLITASTYGWVPNTIATSF